MIKVVGLRSFRAFCAEFAHIGAILLLVGVAILSLDERLRPIILVEYLRYLCIYFKIVLWLFVEAFASAGIRTHKYCELDPQSNLLTSRPEMHLLFQFQ